jgi:hypothetical protein
MGTSDNLVIVESESQQGAGVETVYAGGDGASWSLLHPKHVPCPGQRPSLFTRASYILNQLLLENTTGWQLCLMKCCSPHCQPPTGNN